MAAKRRTAGPGSRPQSAAGLEAGPDGWHPPKQTGPQATAARDSDRDPQGRDCLAGSGSRHRRRVGRVPQGSLALNLRVGPH